MSYGMIVLKRFSVVKMFFYLPKQHAQYKRLTLWTEQKRSELVEC